MPQSPSIFRLASDKQRSGTSYWVAYFRDPNTGKSVKKSTGVLNDGTRRSRKEAEQIAFSAVERGLFKETTKVPTLNVLAQDFWEWGRSTYLDSRLARDPESISPEYAENMSSLLKRHILPALGDLPLSKLTPDVLDEMVTQLLKAGLSTQTVKHAIYALSPIIQHSIRKGLLQRDPLPLMLPFAVRGKTREAFTLEEAQRLLDPDKIQTIWQADQPKFNPKFEPYKHYSISLLAAVTGARIGSILCLRREDICLKTSSQGNFYEVTLHFSLARIQGVKPGSKTGRGTIVPVACEILDIVLPYLPESGYLFPSRGKHGVITSRSALRALESAMFKAGISKEDQQNRLLGFHAWRHTFETRARAKGLSREVRACFTEHKDEKTADRYAHLKSADLLEVLPVQRELVFTVTTKGGEK